jgi:hypothetical protein
MSTNATIAMKVGNKIHAVYLHWDGYVEHAGKVLQRSYNRSKTRKLIALGDLSVIGDEIGNKHDFDSHDCRTMKSCLFYGRDRGEENTEFREFISETEMFMECGTPFYYLMDSHGVWKASRGKTWFNLKNALNR